MQMFSLYSTMYKTDITWLFPGMIVATNIYIFSTLKLIGLMQKEKKKSSKLGQFVSSMTLYKMLSYTYRDSASENKTLPKAYDYG